ncbi:MAG: hypothetical protein WCC06_06835 [Candidatus Aminicenantales bacterium]
MRGNIKFLGLFIILFLWMYSGAAASVTIVNGLTHERETRPGDVYSDFIVIKNTTAAMEEVKLYQTDYFFTFDGKKYYDKPGSVKRSNAAWISFSQKRIMIPPFNQYDVKYTVKVPDDESLKGTYWSLIMVEIVPKNSMENVRLDKKNINFGIQQIMRSGIQIVSHIGNTGTREIRILKIELLKDEEGKILQVDVQNTGERWLRPYLFVDLVDDKGKFIGKYEGDKWRIFPGTSARFCADLSQVPEGQYNALILIDNKDAYVFGAKYNINLKASSPTPKALVRKKSVSSPSE